MTDDRHAANSRQPGGALRAAAAAVLAVPVIGLIIAESLARRVSPTRPGVVVLFVLAGTVALSAIVASSIGALSPPSPSPTAGGEVSPSPSPVSTPTERPTAAVTPSADPSPPPSASPSPAPTPTPAAPAVVRFRPLDGVTGVSRFTAVSVRFTQPMDHDSTEAAFRVVIGSDPVTGNVRWAEGDTVLVLVPAPALPYGARVTLSVDVGARSAAGVPLAQEQSVTFTVQSGPSTAGRPAPAVPAGPAAGAAAPPASAWRWPLIGPITQRFGESLTQYGVHQGIDIDGETGDPVGAARAGRVIVAGRYDDCGGLDVHIDHGDGLESWYRHLSRIDVATGARVSAGTIIGLVGNTGCSLGSHLHFGIRRGTMFVDPLAYLPPR